MTELREVRAFAPASVSNVACGFDALGFAIEGLGDEVIARRTESPGVAVKHIHGDQGKLPLETERNTAGMAALAVWKEAGSPGGIELDLHKGMPLSSGLGSSAASAVAAAVAVNRLLGCELETPELLECCLAGEVVASGARHADNVAPSLLGDLLLVRSLDPEPDIILLPSLPELCCVIIRPDVVINTSESRALLGDSVPLPSAVSQWANLGAFIAALYLGDAALLSRSLVDVIAEPIRGPQVPGFADMKSAAMKHGALGCSLSGSGPALFALTLGQELASRVASAMNDALPSNVERDIYVTPVPAAGAHVREES